MKTTLDLPDSLLAEAKARARMEKITLRRLVEDGLREILKSKRRPVQGFRLRDGARRLGGMRLESWGEIRKTIYAGRGE